MPGRIVRLLVAENSEVEAGQGIVVVEAMKMQNEIKSPKNGVVKKISATPGSAGMPILFASWWGGDPGGRLGHCGMKQSANESGRSLTSNIAYYKDRPLAF